VDTSSKSPNWQIPVAIASALMGVMVSLQFRVQTSNKTSNKQSELIALIKNLEGEREKLTQELQATRSRLSEIETKMGRGDSKAQDLSRQLQDARVQAGLTPMKGPGVLVTLADSKRRHGPDDDPYFFLVHDQDLQSLVNELFAAGAEAVSINDQRISNRSSIRCVGPAILVNTVQLGSPYVVKGIGAAEELARGLQMQNGWADSMAMLIRSGGEVKINPQDEIVVPAYTGSTTFRYGVPVPESEITKAVSSSGT
jgi:uncharacterized protein YlxW (UPF0749 family)